MATLLSLSAIREHVETDLGDDALTRLIEDADQEIIDRLGALAEATEVKRGGGEMLHLDRKAQSISSAVERIGETDYPLAANDYELLDDGYRVQRKQGDDQPASSWRGRVTVVFVPADETAGRKRLLADLVRLAVRYSAVGAERLGDVSVDHVDYQAEREKLFRAFTGRNRRLPLA